ncbi:serine hydrolase [Clostridium cochlearium]|uniref:serine hydrolase n=1 Tax=Clostridium cochlearium TaxID=1494 RepID=UPI001EE12707|nr:serine hydrolase [Clostridium cochlearium]MCG4580716.1 class A beta-lactamase-related serine hydrolase [Clostridium cochlearium]
MSNFNEMVDKIKEKINSFKGTCGVIIKNENTDEYFGHNEEEVFPAASVIKLSIILELFKKIDNKELKLEDRIILDESDKVGGFGVLKELDANLNVTIKDLATLMIILSDNVATNKLIEILDIDQINNTIKELEMKDTILGRKMMDGEAKKSGLDNYTSAKDTLIILETFLNISNIVNLSHESTKTIIEILKKQQCNNKLPLLMPQNTSLAHKTGDLSGVEHDVGILFSKLGDIIIVVLTKDLEDNSYGVQFNNDIGKIIGEYYL